MRILFDFNQCKNVKSLLTKSYLQCRLRFCVQNFNLKSQNQQNFQCQNHKLIVGGWWMTLNSIYLHSFSVQIFDLTCIYEVTTVNGVTFYENGYTHCSFFGKYEETCKPPFLTHLISHISSKFQ